MNEEELKKGCGKRQGRGLNFYICGHLLLNVLCPTCQARLEGFQKGKLEEREKNMDIVDKVIRGFDFGEKIIWVIRERLIKQLQKEIEEEKQDE